MAGGMMEAVPLEAYEGINYQEDDEQDYELSFQIEHDVPMPPVRARVVRQPRSASSDDLVRTFVELPESAKNTAIGKLAGIVADRLEFPEASVFISLLSSASSAVACAYATQYRTHTAVALGLYAIIEQPPATKKSYLLSIGGMPYARAIGEHNKKVAAKNRELRERGIEDREQYLKYAFAVTTDATSAAMDRALSTCSEGRFVIASAEQSALTSLFPEAGTYSSNNELILKGYAGEYVNGMRGGREAFCGEVQGSIVLIAQAGSCRRVISASNGTGMAERFFFMAEPSLLGARELRGEYPSHEDTRAFEDACRKCVELYSDRILSMPGGADRKVLDAELLEKVKPGASGYNLILEKVRENEQLLGDLNAQGEMIAVGWLGKYETHVLKVAGVMHVIESLCAGCYPGEVIPDHVVRTSMDVVDMLSEQLTEILHDADESGIDAEENALIELLTGRPLSKRELLLKAKNRKPYRNMGRQAYAKAQSRLESMIIKGSILINKNGKLETL